jgi:hypothetical protein
MHRSFTTSKRDRVVMCERSFPAHILGHLHFDIGHPIRGDDEFEKVIGDEEENWILRGWHVSPWALSIHERNSVDGLMRDTIWLMIRKNVAAAIMALDWNARIPLGVAFGVAEMMLRHREVLGLLRDARVQLITWAPHTTQIFQQLDVSLFGVPKRRTGQDKLAFDQKEGPPTFCSKFIALSNKR